MLPTLLLAAATLWTGPQSERPEPWPVGAPPAAAREFLASWCLDCHDAATAKGELVLEELALDWSRPETAATLERVRRMLATGKMPPPRYPQPPAADRDAQVAWIDAELAAHLAPGGGGLRRLNRLEYEGTVHTIFPLRRRLEVALPPDTPAHGFDTVGEALVVSPTHLRQYLEAATWVADELIPLATGDPVERLLEARDFVGTRTHHLDGRQRLVNSIDVIARSAGRTERFLAPRDGVYRFALTAAAFTPEQDASDAGVPPRLEVRAWLRGRSTLETVTGARLLASFELDSQQPRALEFEGELLEGETLLCWYANSPLTARGRFVPRPVLRHHHQRAPELFEALAAVGFDRTEVDEVNQARLLEHVRTGGPPPDEAQREAFRAGLEEGRLASEFVTVFGFHAAEHGPAIDLLSLAVEGPVRELETLTRWLPRTVDVGERSVGPEEPSTYARAVLAPLLRRAFRRPVEQAELERYVTLAVEHAAEAGSLRHGLHLALRTILCAPDFLYRDARPGPLDDFALVTRLSYLLWTAPPPDQLLDLAAEPGSLDDAEVDALVRRMIESPHAARFAEHFTGQWLRTRELAGIMPDERLFPVWDAGLYRALPQETEAFFLHVLRENLPVDRFLDSDFAFLNQQNARIYGVEGVEGIAMRAVELPPDSPRGGVLGMASVLMATANGVDTSPVLRGVWVLENLLGEPPPPPPDDVPALSPDAGGATTVREALAVHRADPSCARCHDDIDPLGFALEELDPVGGLRAHYPELVALEDGTTELRPGPPVDARGTLPDGTVVEGLRGLKQYLLLHRGRFAHCLTEKLLVYGTGRAPGPGDRLAAEAILAGLEDPEAPGFLDLLVAVATSPAFRHR